MLARILQQQQQSLRNLKTQIIPHRQMSSKFIFHFIFPARSTMSHVPYVPLPLTVRSADFHTRVTHTVSHAFRRLRRISTRMSFAPYVHTHHCVIYAYVLCVTINAYALHICTRYAYLYLSPKRHTEKNTPN